MLNVDTAINLLCKLDYMKEYHAFGLLRVLNRSDLALTLKGDVEKHAKKMSSIVRLGRRLRLAAACGSTGSPFSDVQQGRPISGQATRVQARL